MLTLVYDTETSGLPNDGPLSGQPHLVQLAAILVNGDREIARMSTVVKCPVEIHPKATAAHGYTREMTQDLGVDVKVALSMLEGMSDYASIWVAHNSAFDLKILKIAFDRLEWIYEAPRNDICTMRLAEPHCRIPATDRQIAAGFKKPGEFKQPRLDEALRILCAHELEGAHDALADCAGAWKLYRWLRDNGHVQSGLAAAS